MIAPRDITVVVQGDVRSNTMSAMAAVRAVLPGATLVLSTFEGEPVGELARLVDRVVRSPDPGAQVPYTRSRFATVNNLNRQIVSTRAGLQSVETPYALKLRSDAILLSDDFVRTFAAVDGGTRILACSRFTRHPSGLSGYLFHVSDWFMFAATPQLQEFWDVPLMTDEDASWFDCNPHRRDSTLAARRFRARYTPEQYLTVAYARRHGYDVPAYLNDRTTHLVAEYRRFIARNFIIDAPSALGFVLPKYRHVASSLFQAVDCISRLDWLAQYRKALPGERPPTLGRSSERRRDQLVQFGLRQLAHVFRHPVIALVQGRQKLVQMLRSSAASRSIPKSSSYKSQSSDA